jgi:glycosyltransferase involved in cell wall biosynthesis
MEQTNTGTPIKIVHCGVDVSRFSPTTDNVPQRIVTVSRNEPKKGLKFGIEALSRITASHPKVEWRIIGAEGGKLVEVIERTGMADHVSLLGQLSDNELIQELDKASLTLLPCVIDEHGNRDGIPVALMEAMAMKTVPISSPVAGIPELITDGVSGYLSTVISEGDGLHLGGVRHPSVSNDLIQTLDSALSEAQDSKAERARRVITNSFTIENQVNQIEKIFQSVVEA